MYIKKCKYCNKEFSSLKYNKSCCSDECRRLYVNNKKNVREESKRIYYTKNCIKCNNEFVTFWSRKKFCSRTCMQKYWDKKHADKRPRKTNKKYNEADEIRKKHFSLRQKSIILGTLLGDGCLIKSSKTEESTLYRLSLTHSDRQKEYIEWKWKEMRPFTSDNGLIRYERKDGKLRKDGSPLVQYHVTTIGHDELARIKGLLYRGKKKFVTRRYLNMLDPLSLAVWYMDDGSYNQRSMRLHTSGFSLSEHNAIKIWFWQKWRIECKISIIKNNKNQRYGTRKQYYYLRFNVNNTRIFHDLVRQYIIPSMQYKINT